MLGYIGPGAGFALAGSFLALFGALFSALVMIVFWPLRRLMRLFFRRRPPGRSRFKRVVILGLDGLDYRLTQRLLSEGRLPHLARLRARGGFAPLASTLPPISPVAWSTFQTGVNPGKHNIFDFLTPDPATYEPKLSSVEIRSGVRRIGVGPLRWTWRRPDIRLLRKSRPFWSLLGEFGIFSCVQRVPITFPPRSSAEFSFRRCAFPTSAARRGRFPCTLRNRAARG